MRQTIALLLFLCLVTFTHGQNSSPAPSEEALAEASPHTKVSSGDVVRSPHHMAWVEKQGNLRMVFLDGKQLAARTMRWPISLSRRTKPILPLSPAALTRGGWFWTAKNNR